MREVILYVGGDDSNHGANLAGSWEVILATFSFLPNDSIVRNFQNTRNRNYGWDWINHPARDYRFTLINAGKYRGGANLPIFMPHLIGAFLDDHDFDIDKLCIYLDGNLDARNRESLVERVREYERTTKIVVANFIKKRRAPSRRGDKKSRISKRPRCPPLVYVADILAHDLKGISPEDAGESLQFVEFDEELSDLI